MTRFKVPILLVIFNRPDKVKLLIESLRIIKPEVLFVTADGPRENNRYDSFKCNLVKKEVENIDWECTIHTNYSNKNLGCKIGVSSGIDWFFSHVEFGIIIEDDIIPNISFYRFCEELLFKYKDNQAIGMISGCNPIADEVDFNGDSYSYSTYANIWGWATWKRAWKNNDTSMYKWIEWRKNDSNFMKLSQVKYFKLYWKDILNSVYIGKIDTWDFQWFFSLWINNQLCIVPKYNLIDNIGFDKNATHTNGKFPSYLLKNRPKDIEIIMTYPKVVNRNIDLDNAISNTVFKISFWTIIKNNLHRNKFLGNRLVKLRRLFQ